MAVVENKITLSKSGHKKLTAGLRLSIGHSACFELVETKNEALLKYLESETKAKDVNISSVATSILDNIDNEHKYQASKQLCDFFAVHITPAYLGRGTPYEVVKKIQPHLELAKDLSGDDVFVKLGDKLWGNCYSIKDMSEGLYNIIKSCDSIGLPDPNCVFSNDVKSLFEMQDALKSQGYNVGNLWDLSYDEFNKLLVQFNLRGDVGLLRVLHINLFSDEKVALVKEIERLGYAMYVSSGYVKAVGEDGYWCEYKI